MYLHPFGPFTLFMMLVTVMTFLVLEGIVVGMCVIQ